MPRKRSASEVPQTSLGSFQSLDHVANWVRFADTKATILTAGLGVIATMLVANCGIVLNSFSKGCLQAAFIGLLSALCIAAFGYTLFWLIRSIGPSTGSSSGALNRFAWPTLSKVDFETLKKHINDNSLEDDAWNQVIDLAKIAEKKFHACSRAIMGFAFLISFALMCIIVANIIVN